MDTNNNGICDKYENWEYLARSLLPYILILVSVILSIVSAFIEIPNTEELIKINMFSRELGLAFLGLAKKPR